jgi:predicted unusual protein kinase regulating ubiquinone biosynthesis (AarF/ABC1/UbiB family)
MGRRQWQLTFIDFGMVGRVPKGLSDGLRDLLIAVGTRDAAKMVQAYQKVGILLPSADLELLEKAEAQLFERYWGKSMSELTKISPKEIHEFAQEFSQLLFSLPFQIPQDLLLLGRAVGILSGMCTGLNPQFNVWEHIVPFAEKMIAEQARGSASIWVDELKQLARTILTTPLKLDSLLSQLQRGDLAVRAPDTNKQIIRLEMAVRQVAGAMIFAALLLGGIQLNLGGQHAFSWVIFVGAGAALLWTVIGNR